MKNKNLLSIEHYAESFGTNKHKPKDYIKYLKRCVSLKETYISNNDEENAKRCLLLESILQIQHNYLKTYKLILKNKHESAWSCIIDIENEIELIKPYIEVDFAKYKLDIVKDKNTKIQTLFPYTLFFSAGYTVGNYRCSICGEVITLRHRCNHKKGQIYNGSWCFWIKENITNFDHVAVVTNPKDKRCIPKEFNGKRFDFSVVDELVIHIKRPYLNWDLKWSKLRHPHDFFKDVKETDYCPCGSDKLYKDCCLKESGVLRPHVDFDFGQGFSDNPNIIKYHYPKSKDNVSAFKSDMQGIIMTMK